MRRTVGELLRINVSIPLWGVLSAGVIVICAIYFCAPQYREEVKFVSVVLGGAAAIYTAYYVGAALRIGIHRDRQKASFEILDLLNRPEFVKVRSFLDECVEGHENMAATALYEKIDSDQELDDAVTTVLGILEDASIAIQQGYVDEDVLYLSLKYIVKRHYRGLHGYIDQLRKRKGIAVAFCELEKLAQSWDSRTRLSDGKSLPTIDAVETS